MKYGIQTALTRFCLFLSGAVFIAGPAAAVDFSAWLHSADFRLNTTSTGAAIAGEVADFPVLIRLDGASFPFAEAKGDGGDIRFSDPGGRELPLEIERWDAAAKRAEIWVKVPLIKPGTDTGFIRMHWGNVAAVPVSDGKAVFDTGRGFAGVWHLGGIGARNAAGSTGDGEEIRTSKLEALIAEGTAFIGGNLGIVLSAGPALNPNIAITASAWIHADSWKGGNHRILQSGASEAGYALFQDNDSLVWLMGGPAGSQVIKAPLPDPGAWHHVAATYDGAVSRLYVDGKPAASGRPTGDILAPSEALCLGCRAAQGKPHNSFEGLLDEITLSRVVRSEDWIKLSFANQRGQQILVLPPSLGTCQARFDAPADTAVLEGKALVLAGTADCAKSFSWSGIQGPVPRILDPEVKSLTLVAPRIPRDTTLVVRFTARFEDGERTRDVRVTVREAIPDPVFSMPAKAAWNGKDTLAITPSIANLAAVKASRDSIIRFAWTLTGLAVDTLWRKGSLLLRQPFANGELGIRLCLDNGGAAACDSTTVTVALPVGLLRTPRLPMGLRAGADHFDARGRRLPAGREGVIPESPGLQLFMAPSGW